MDTDAEKVGISPTRYWWLLAVLSARETWTVVLDNRPSAVVVSLLAVLASPAFKAANELWLRKPVASVSSLLGDMVPGAAVLVVVFIAAMLVKLFLAPASLHTRQLERIRALEATASDDDAEQVVLAALVELREQGFRLLRNRGVFGSSWGPWAHRCEIFLEQNVGALEASRFRHSQSEPQHFSPDAQLRCRLESLDDVIRRVEGKAITVIVQAPLSDAVAMRLMDREDEVRRELCAEKEYSAEKSRLLHESLEGLGVAVEQNAGLKALADHSLVLVDQMTENFDRMSQWHDLAFEALSDVSRLLDPHPGAIAAALGVGPMPPQERVVRVYKRIRAYYSDRVGSSTQRSLPPPSDHDTEKLPS